MRSSSRTVGSERINARSAWISARLFQLWRAREGSLRLGELMLWLCDEKKVRKEMKTKMDKQEPRLQVRGSARRGRAPPQRRSCCHLIDRLIFIIDLFVNLRQKTLDQI